MRKDTMTEQEIFNKCKPCPKCKRKDALKIQTYNIFDHFTNATDIRCERCKVWASANEDDGYVDDSQESAIMRWNNETFVQLGENEVEHG